MAKSWRMTKKQVVGVAQRAYAYEDGAYRVRVRWSKKLGLELKQGFDTVTEARTVADRVAKADKLTVALWDKEFYPGGSYIVDCRTPKPIPA